MSIAIVGLITACSDSATTEPDAMNAVRGPSRWGSSQSTGPVAAFGFNEASGQSVEDASGSGNAGTFGQGVTRTTDGRFGGALKFDGSGAVTIPNRQALQLSSKMTLEAWVNPSTTGSSQRDVIEKGRDNYYLLATSGSNRRPGGGASFRSGGATTAYGSSAIAANTWTHLAVTYDGANLQFYVNGTRVSSVRKTGSLNTSTSSLLIGGSEFSSSQSFVGMIDEVRVYDRALSATEIQNDMKTPIGTTSGSTPGSTDTTAPTVSITSPTSSSTYSTTAKSVTLGISATDNVGVTEVTWSNDRGGSGAATKATTWSAADIPLQSGANVLTVTARDAAGNATSTKLTVTVTTLTVTATRLSITGQPTTAQSGAVFSPQPAVQLRDSSNAPVKQSGILITAALASGTGTLGGTLTATTDANGAATFGNLAITGSGSYTIRFSSNNLAVVSAPISITAPPSGGQVVTPPQAGNLASNDFEGKTLTPTSEWQDASWGGSVIDDPTGSGHGKVFRNTFAQSSTPNGFADLNRYISWNPRSGALGHGSTTWFRGDFFFPKNTVNFTESQTLRKLTYWRTGDGGTNQCDFVIGMYGNQVFVSVVVPGTTEIMDWNVVSLNAGQWYRLELGVVMNSAPGVANGSIAMYLDGKQVYSRSKIAFTRPSDPTNKSWIWLAVGHQREGNGKETSISEERYWDNLAFSTARIGQ